MSRPSTSGSEASDVRNCSEFEQLAQIDLLAPHVRQLDADGVAPGHDGGAHRSRAQRARKIVGKSDHARRLDAARRLELEQRDDGTGVNVLDLAPDSEVAEHACQQLRLAAQLGRRGLGPGFARGRPLQQAERGTLVGASAPPQLRRIGGFRLGFRMLAECRRAGQLGFAAFGYRLAGGTRLWLEALGNRAGLLVGQVIEGTAAARIRHLRVIVGHLCDRNLLHRGLFHVKHWRLTDQRRIRPDRRRRVRSPYLPLPLPPPASDGFEPIEPRPHIGLADQLEVPLGQAEAPHQRHQPTGKAEEPGGGTGAIGVEVAEQARQQAQPQVAEQPAVAVMQRPRLDLGKRGEGAGYEQHRQRRQHELAAQAGRSLSRQQLQGPEQRRQQHEDAGQAQHLHREVGEDGAGGPEQIARGAAGGAAEARIGGRPGKQAHAHRRAGSEQKKAQHSPEPPLKPALERGRKQGGRVVAPVRHTRIGAVTLLT